MHTFTDARARSWDVVLDVSAIKRVKGLLGVNLYDLVDDGAKGLGELLGDPCRLVDVVYVLCREQCQAQGLTDEDFGRGFSGDSLEAAGEAFVAELLDFFPNRQARTSLRKLLEKGREAGRLYLEQTGEKVDAIDPAALVAKWRASSGSAPASSASTPGPSPSAS